MWLQKRFSDPSCEVVISQKLYARPKRQRKALFGTASGLFESSTKIVHLKSCSFRPAKDRMLKMKCGSGSSRRRTVLSRSCKTLASRTSTFRSRKGGVQRTSFLPTLWKLTTTSACALVLTGTIASAEGMVLVMQGDGSLVESSSQSNFARNYNDGVGQGSASEGLQLFGRAEKAPAINDGSFRVAAVTPRAVAPRPEILAAIDETALRYASHPALRRAGLSVTEWRLLFRSNLEIESAYNPNARSQVGAIGLGQLMPETASDLGVDPHNWQQNLDGSARYLLMMLVQFGDAQLALAAYNAGADAVTRYGGIPPYRETQNHVSRVLAVFNRLEGENS